jgi:hypothetical protein
MLDGIKCGPDGMRADVFGNLWISSTNSCTPLPSSR